MIDTCLRFSVDIRTWYGARNQCLMSGGDLAIIDNADQMLAKTLSLNQSYWIGLRKTFWRWTLNHDGLFNIDEFLLRVSRNKSNHIMKMPQM